MLKYHYRARSQNGAAVEGEVNAEDKAAALKLLSEQNLIPISVTHSPLQALGKDLKQTFGFLFGAATKQDLLIFTQQLQVVYSVGVPILKGIQLIEKQTENKQMKAALEDVARKLAEGKTLHASMSEHPHIFDNVYIGLIKMGEVSGQLEAVLERLYTIIETNVANRGKIKSALFYPKMVLGSIFLVNGIIIYFVIPKIKNFYKGMGNDLPQITKVLLGISDFVVSYSLFIGVLGFGLFYGTQRILRIPKVRLWWDGLMLKAPVIGPLLLQVEMNSFCVVMGLLLKSGVNIIAALEILKDTITNKAVAQDIEIARGEVERGKNVSQGLEKGEVFTPMLKNLIVIGEETGSVSKVLVNISNYYRVQIEQRFANLSKAIEPLLLSVIFGMVGFLAIAIFLPIWKMSSGRR